MENRFSTVNAMSKKSRNRSTSPSPCYKDKARIRARSVEPQKLWGNADRASQQFFNDALNDLRSSLPSKIHTLFDKAVRPSIDLIALMTKSEGDEVAGMFKRLQQELARTLKTSTTMTLISDKVNAKLRKFDWELLGHAKVFLDTIALLCCITTEPEDQDDDIHKAVRRFISAVDVFKRHGSAGKLRMQTAAMQAQQANNQKVRLGANRAPSTCSTTRSL